MIRTDQDVMNSGRDELSNYGKHALACSREVFHTRLIHTQNELCWCRIVLIYVHERLVIWIVREHHRGDGDDAWRTCNGVLQVEPDRLPVLDNFALQPFRTQRTPICR